MDSAFSHAFRGQLKPYGYLPLLILSFYLGDHWMIDVEMRRRRSLEKYRYDTSLGYVRPDCGS
jgi:hypothetical protein